MRKAKRRGSDEQTEKPAKRVFAVILIAAVALTLRLIVAHSIGQMPISRTPNLDAFEYLARARKIAAGDFTWPTAPAHAPLYPFALALMLYATGGSLIAARAIQGAIGALTCVVTALTGIRFFGERAGYAAGLLLAIYGPLIWIDVSLLAEGLLVFLLALLLWSMATDRHPAITGAIAGLAALTRPTALIFLPLVIVAARTWRARAVVVFATIAVIAPVTIVNWRTSHAFLPIQAYGGLNFYLGNSPLRDGTASARLGAEWERIAPEAARRGILTPFGEDHYFLEKTNAQIVTEPFAYFRLLLRKALWTFQNEEIRDTDSFYFYRQFAPLLRWLPTFSVLFAFACAGMVLANWHERAPSIVAAYIALSALTCVALVVGSRYRMPIVIGCALFGGLIVQSTSRRRAVAAISAGLLAGGCTLVWQYPATHDFAEEWALTARSLRQERDAAGSEDAARRGVAADPSSALAWDELGMALGARGFSIEAADAFRHAIAINPDFTDAHVHAGMVASDRNDPEQAALQFAQAVQLDPRSVNAWGRLGDIEARRGNLAAADTAYKRFLALQPDNPYVLFALARTEGALGRPAEGLALAERAQTLSEPTGDDWLMMAILSMQAGRYDAAESDISRAGQTLQNDPRVPFTSALLRFQQRRYAEADAILERVMQQYPGFHDAAVLRRRIEEMARKR